MMTDTAKKLCLMAFMLLAPVVIDPQPARAQSPAHQSAEQDGLTLVSLITSDLDWQEKWDTPSDHIPEFNTASTLKLGEEAALLVLFAGAEIHEGAIHLICDLTINKPDGTSKSHADIPCASGAQVGPNTNLRMTSLSARIIAETGDPSGLYTFEIGLTDAVRGIRISTIVGIEMQIGEGSE